MNSFALIAFLFIVVLGLLFLVAIAVAIYAIVVSTRNTKRLDRIDALEQEVRNLREEVNSLRGVPPALP